MRNDAAHQAKLLEGKRMAALFRITDALWPAIHNNRYQESARLMRELRELTECDKARKAFDAETDNRS